MNDIPPLRALPGPDADALSRNGQLAPRPAAGRPARAGWLHRRARMLVAGTLVAVACYGLLRQQISVGSEHAVISAAVMPLRTPIGGLVTELDLHAGEAVPLADRIARVENDRPDRRRLQDAVAERDLATTAADALTAEIATLDILAADLSRRASGQPEGAHPGANSYREQRLDEIALRRADLARQLAMQQAALARAQAAIAEESARLAQDSDAMLRADAGRLAWRIMVSHGERVTAGEALAELVDCRAVFLLAAVGQRDVPHVATGQAARILIDGEQAPRYGKVAGWLPEAMLSQGGRIAVAPSRPQGGSRVVRVTIDQPQTGTPCPIGRTGRVIFDTELGLPGL